MDDSNYLGAVITEIEARYTVDAKRIFIAGHSNGGFMSYRMACNHADQIAAVVSLSGAMWDDATRCAPSAGVSIVEIHGRSDAPVAFGDGAITEGPDGGAVSYPGAATTVADWATLDGGGTIADTGSQPLDLDSILPGAETTVTRYASACRGQSDAELWTIQGGSHNPGLGASFGPHVIDFLFAHPKP